MTELRWRWPELQSFGRSQVRVLLVALAGLGVAAVAAGSSGWQGDLPAAERVAQTIEQLGVWGLLAYVSLVVGSVIISPIPGAPLAAAAGAVWGTVWAGTYSTIGAFLGSLAAYAIGRQFGRPATCALLGRTITVAPGVGDRYLGWFVFATRLLPVVSFGAVSYAAGAIRLSLPVYAVATLLGALLPTFGLAYTGSALATGQFTSVSAAAAGLLLLGGLAWRARQHPQLHNVLQIERSPCKASHSD